MSDEQPTTNVGTDILFENDVVRLWRMRLAPGESSSCTGICTTTSSSTPTRA